MLQRARVPPDGRGRYSFRVHRVELTVGIVRDKLHRQSPRRVCRWGQRLLNRLEAPDAIRRHSACVSLYIRLHIHAEPWPLRGAGQAARRLPLSDIFRTGRRVLPVEVADTSVERDLEVKLPLYRQRWVPRDLMGKALRNRGVANDNRPRSSRRRYPRVDPKTSTRQVARPARCYRVASPGS